MAPASPLTTAQIISLPTAAAAPVRQTRLPGRWPACVIPANQLARKRVARYNSERQTQNEAMLGRLVQMAATTTLPKPASNWPFSALSMADYALLNDTDRKRAETYIVGIVSVRRQDAKKD